MIEVLHLKSNQIHTNSSLDLQNLKIESIENSNRNMNSYSIDIKTEKAKAIFRQRRLQQITTVFRFIEILVFVILISRFSSQFKVSTDHLRGISFAILSPRFVFVIGNVIILILLFNSRSIEDEDRDLKIGVRMLNTAGTVRSKERKICRSQSENLMRVERKDDETHRKLRRSVTERRTSETVDCGGGETTVVAAAAKDELSNEEFRRTVEAFILRQQQCLRDEELAPVAYIGA